MAGGKHIIKKRHTEKQRTGGKEAPSGAKVELAVKIDVGAKARHHERTAGEHKRKLTESERQEIIRRVMAEEKRGKSEGNSGQERGTGAEQELIERQKRVIMWSGVTFFMILVSVFWVYSMKLTVQSTPSSPVNDLSFSHWQDLTEELESRVDEMNATADKIGEFSRQDREESATTSEARFGESASFPDGAEAVATGTDNKIPVSDHILEQLENKLKNKN